MEEFEESTVSFVCKIYDVLYMNFESFKSYEWLEKFKVMTRRFLL